MKIISFIIASMLSVSMIAGNPEYPEKYCVKMKDGKKVVMHEGKVVTADVALSNGSKIQMDGTIVKPDGSTTMLKEGQCISKDGVIADEHEKKTKPK